MGHYWKRCPHCGCTIEKGYGFPTKYFGTPEKQCRYCLHTYRDKDIIDWETASLVKKLSYCLANGRFFLCFIPYIIATARIGSNVDWEDWQVYLVCLPIFLFIFALCAIYVKIQVRIYYGKKDKHYKHTITENKYKDGLFENRTSANKDNKRRR